MGGRCTLSPDGHADLTALGCLSTHWLLDLLGAESELGRQERKGRGRGVTEGRGEEEPGGSHTGNAQCKGNVRDSWVSSG